MQAILKKKKQLLFLLSSLHEYKTEIGIRVYSLGFSAIGPAGQAKYIIKIIQSKLWGWNLKGFERFSLFLQRPCMTIIHC